MADLISSHLITDFLPLALVKLDEPGTILCMQSPHNILSNLHLVLLADGLKVHIVERDDHFAKDLIPLVLVVRLVLAT